MKAVKCIVWDMDNTLWQGTLVEDGDVQLDPILVEIICRLDRLGVLHSVASRNDFEPVWQKLLELGVEHYFLAPQIHWRAKSDSVQAIADTLNLSPDTFLFIDDQAFEREEVKSKLPMVRCFAPQEFVSFYQQQCDKPGSIFPQRMTQESRKRRQLYATECRRQEAQKLYAGDNQAFLDDLGLRLTVEQLQVNDLQRASELTERTNQLNTTGYTYSENELQSLMVDPDYLVIKAELTDRFGDYGIIGLCIAKRTERVLLIKLLLMSCRVMNRSLGGAFLDAVKSLADQDQLLLEAEFVPNERNRQMLITYRFAGFKTVRKEATDVTLLRHDAPEILLTKSHVAIRHLVLDRDTYG